MKLSNLTRFAAPSGRGSILVIALLLIGSAGIRIATGAGGAFAQASQLPTTAQAMSKEQDTAHGLGHETQSGMAATPIYAAASKSEMSALIQALTEREHSVAEREKQLELRFRALTVADAEIEKRLISLSETEASLRATLALADQAAEKDLSRLTSVFESMKPK